MDHQGDNNQRPGRRLIRGADGRLRSAESSADIGDIWAEQKRIRLNEAIQEDQRRAEKQKKRAEKSREVVVNLSLPKFRLPKVKPKLPKISKKWLIIAVLAVLLAGAGFVAYKVFIASDEPKVVKGVLGTGEQVSQTPDFTTVLPKGKNIDELGGWARVSPPDKDPAFAYVDVVDGTQLNVSQQQLPERFKQDKDGELAKLAEQFSANEKITVGETVVYIGTSSKGPQSVITSIDGLLILIKSAGPLTNEQWSKYIASLG